MIGVDEVGRGCWAGPLVAGAVILKTPIEGLRDSKKLSKKQRERLAEAIYERAAAVGLGWVTPAEVDALGLTVAVSLAMHRAVLQINVPYDEILIDGNFDYLAEHALQAVIKTLVKADDLVPAVSAASIVAKVARDNFMAEQARLYPEYGFENHVGYGTAAHSSALQKYGVTAIHRRSYKPIQKLEHEYAMLAE
jgi:ribonuclease HII